MDLSQETDDYIRESIEYSLGLPVSTQTLQLKLRASEESVLRLKNQYLSLQAKFKEKDELIDRVRAESSINAIALKKFVEENQRLAVECSNLLAQCKRLEKECSLYDHDREVLMDFGNEADERAKEAEVRVLDLEEEVRKLSEELHFFKGQYEAQMDDAPKDDVSVDEQNLLNTVLETVINRDDAASRACALLEASIGTEVCQELSKKWIRLKPSTQKVISLAAEVKSLQKDKELLRINLAKAEEEVNVLSENYQDLAEENKKVIRLYQERLTPGSGGKLSSSKGSKRKSSPKSSSSPVEGKADFSEVDSLRYPLSPLRENSPEYRLHKK